MGGVQAAPRRGAGGSVGGKNVMHLRGGVKREPVADEGQPVREGKSAKARSGIVATILGVAAGGGEADKTLCKSANGDGRVALATPDHGALEAKFKVIGR